METLLRYEHVDISYGESVVIHEACFSLAEGEILGIVGESGSGKSTILKAAMNLLGWDGLVTRGDIWYRGKNLPDLPVEEQRKIYGPGLGMVFQNAGSSFCPVRKIGVQLQEMMAAHGCQDRKSVKEKAMDILGKFGFEDPRRILDSYPFELSGGMQQRVGVAAAMLLRPRVLLADEPTSALDVTVQKQVIEEMLLARNLFGTAILLVTHNMGVLRAMADRMLVLHKGETVEYGRTQEVMACPQSDYTQKLLAAVPRLKRCS